MSQALEDALRSMACDPTLNSVQRKHLTDALNQLGSDRAVIQQIADNLGCGPENVVQWSQKVKAGMLELDRLQQEAAQSRERSI